MISETYPEEYLDINFLSNILFDYIYTPDTESKKCYEIEPLDYKNISISDIKLSLDKARQKKLVNNIFNTKIEWLWRKRNNFLFKRPMNIYTTNIYLKIINKSDDQFNLNSNLNMNSLITLLLSDLVIMKKTRGILLNLMNVDIEFEFLEDFYSIIPEIAPDFLEIENKKDKVINITVFEHFFKMELLSKIILDLTWDQLKSIIFQVAHTLAVIQTEFNGYRHNNLFTTEIFVYIKKPKINIYRIGSKEIQMNDEGFETKLGSFSKSYIPKIAENNDITESNKELDNIKDLLNFLEDIQNKVKDNIKENIKLIINNIKKNDKNILLSNIIMTNNLFNTQKSMSTQPSIGGGSGNKKKDKKSKNRVIKGIRYLSNSDIFLESKSKELPDSLSSFSENDSVNSKSDRFKFSEEDIRPLKSKLVNNYAMQMPANMGMQMPGNMSMQMPGNMGMQMPGNMGMQMPGNMGMQMPANMGNYAGDQQISNDELVKLGIMPPVMGSHGLARTSANLSQMGGDRQGSDEFINIGHNNFFF